MTKHIIAKIVNTQSKESGLKLREKGHYQGRSIRITPAFFFFLTEL